MTEASERDREMAEFALAGRLTSTTDYVARAIAAAREEGRREPRQITEAMIAAFSAEMERQYLTGNAPLLADSAVRAGLEAAEAARSA